MSIVYTTDRSGIDWAELADLRERAPLGRRDAEKLRAAFAGSYCAWFAHDDATGRLVGFIRAISDGVFYSVLHDLAVDPGYQGRGIGDALLRGITRQLNDDGIGSVILISVAGKLGYYRRRGFRSMTSAMVQYSDPERTERMLDGGYIVDAWPAENPTEAAAS